MTPGNPGHSMEAGMQRFRGKYGETPVRDPARQDVQGGHRPAVRRLVPVCLALTLAACHLTDAPGNNSPVATETGPGRLEYAAAGGGTDNLKVLVGDLQERLARLETDLLPQQQERRRPLPVVLAGRAVDVARLPSLGNSQSGIAIIEVTDFQCPFCRTHFNDVFPVIRRELVETGLAQYFVMDYPLPGHELGAFAAGIGRCVQEQGKYWSYHDELFRMSALDNRAAITGILDRLDLNRAALTGCTSQLPTEEYVQRQRSLAVGLGVRGTPTFLIGRLSGDGVARNLTVLHGLQSVEDFHQLIRKYRHE